MRKYSKELLEPIVKGSKTWADVCRYFNIKASTGAQTYIKKVIVGFNIDHSHFIGQGWRIGRKFGLKYPIENFLISNSTIGSHRLKLKLFISGLKEKKCEACGISEWQREELPLELDHINNDPTDCRLENLKILCPNCHSIKTRYERKIRSRGGTRHTRRF